jgi:hypothetical protein
VERDPTRTAAVGARPTGMHAWLDLLVRLARAPLASIASIADAPAARGASSCWPVTCGSPARDNTLLDRFGEALPDA